MYKHVIGKEEALEFARQNLTLYKSSYLEDIERGFKRHYLYDRTDAMKEALVIDGVSELLDIYEFSTGYGNKFNGEPDTYWCFEGSSPAVRLLKTGQMATPYREKQYKGFGLSLLREERTSGRLNGFKFDGVRPDFIGMGSERKLNAWFDYLNAEESAKKEFIETANKRNREFLDKVQAKFPKAESWVNEIDGWCRKIQISVGYVLMTFEAGDDGRFNRSTRVDILNLPTTEELLK